jgi:stage II sporulation protein P
MILILVRGLKWAAPGEEANITLPSEQAKSAKNSGTKVTATFDNILEIASDFNDLMRFVYSVDATAYVDKKDLPIEEFLQYDFKTDLKGKKPKILIFHTHSQEAYANSKKGEVDDTIVGVGRKLAEILTKEYGINVVHDVGIYDVADGKEQRAGSYEKMEPATKSILKKYPSIEIAIDLHRDALAKNTKLVTSIDGKPTAKIMYFNGVSKENKNGKPNVLSNLYNPYQKENLAFSLQMFLTTNEMYPDLARRNFIKPYRYSLHLLPKSLLIEVGSTTNTVQEAKNAMYALADVLVKLIK